MAASGAKYSGPELCALDAHQMVGPPRGEAKLLKTAAMIEQAVGYLANIGNVIPIVYLARMVVSPYKALKSSL